MSVLSMDFGTGMARLRSVDICCTEFYVSSPNENDGTVGFGSANREIIYLIN